MIKSLYTISGNSLVADDTFRLELQAGETGREISGEFVHLSIPDFYLRRPFSICDAGDGKLTIFYKVVGEGTKVLSKMCVGEKIDVLAKLGRGFSADECKESALLVGGGLGAAPLHFLAKELKAEGKRIHAVLGFNKASEVVLEEEFRALCDSLTFTSLDGSLGIKGFVTDALKASLPQYDYFYTCGPMIMMKAVCDFLEGPGEASLEERMGCGAGFCYGCSIQTAKGVRRVCTDGPVFKKEDILW